MIRKEYFKFSFLMCIIVGLIFAICSVVFYFGDWVRAAFVFFWGIFVEALAVPEIEPDAVKQPVVFQTIVGAIGGSLAAIAFDSSNEYIVIVSIVGALLGFTARFWVRYIQIP